MAGRRSSADKVTEQCFQAAALARVLFLGDGSSLAPQLEAEQRIFHFIEAEADFAVNSRCEAWRSAREAAGCMVRKSMWNWSRCTPAQKSCIASSSASAQDRNLARRPDD